MEIKQWGYYSPEWCNLISSIWQLTEHGKKYLRNPGINISREVVIWVWLVQDFGLWCPNLTKLVQLYPLLIHLQLKHATDLPIYQNASGVFGTPFYMRNKKIQTSAIYDLKPSL